MTKTLAGAHRLGLATLGAVVLGGMGLLGRDTQIPLPLLSIPVPASLLVSLAVVVVGMAPLYGIFPDFEGTLARERSLRLTLGSTAILLTALAVTPTLTSLTVGGDWDRTVETTRLALLLAIGIVSVILIGELAWLVVLVGALVPLIADDGIPGRPVRTALLLVGVGPALTVLAAALLWYVWKGARVLR